MSNEVRRFAIDDAFRHRLIAYAHNAHTTGDPDAKHRQYYECRECGGTDERREARRPSFAAVEHGPHCSLAPLVADQPADTTKAGGV